MRSLSLSLLLVCAIASGEEKAPAAADANPALSFSKDQREYVDKTAKLNTLTNRIIEQEKRFLAAVHAKSVAKTPAEKKRLIEELTAVAADRNRDVESYNRIRMDVKLRYPNQGVALDRRYNTHQKKSVEELEGVAGLDELLTLTKKIIDKKYAPLLIEEAQRNNIKPTVLKSADEEKPKRLRLEK